MTHVVNRVYYVTFGFSSALNIVWLLLEII